MINISKPTLRNIPDIKKIIDSGYLSRGPYTEQFEKAFAAYCGCQSAITVNSGTSALHTALSALRLKKKEVITTPISFIATANAILMAGLKPKFVDISEDDYNLNPDNIHINRQTGAILPVDIYGQVYDYKKVMDIIKGKDIKIVEDAAQAAGAMAYGKKAGTFGDIGCFSLYATKNLTAGEGGVITTNNKEMGDWMRLFRRHGCITIDGKDKYLMLGYSYSMTEIQAALVLDHLKQLDRLNEKRRQNAEYLKSHLKGIAGLILPKEKRGFKHIYHQFVVQVDKEEYGLDREQLRDYMMKNGIRTSIHYPEPIHLTSLYRKMGYKEGDFPIAEQFCERCLSIPVHPYLSKNDLKKIVKAME